MCALKGVQALHSYTTLANCLTRRFNILYIKNYSCKKEFDGRIFPQGGPQKMECIESKINNFHILCTE